MQKQRRRLKRVYKDSNVVILATEDKTYAEAIIFNMSEKKLTELLNVYSRSVRDRIERASF